MADGADSQVPWDDQTGQFIDDMDATMQQKHGISLRKLLLDPQAYSGTAGVSDKIKKIKADVDDYFSGALSELSEDEEELTRELERIDSIYTQASQTISNRAGIARVPMIKPADVGVGSQEPETVYIDQYSPQLDLLITKLINISNYVCDLSVTYRKYNIGNWLFSGARTYLISVQQPESAVITVENSRDLVVQMLEDASDRLSRS